MERREVSDFSRKDNRRPDKKKKKKDTRSSMRKRRRKKKKKKEKEGILQKGRKVRRERRRIRTDRDKLTQNSLEMPDKERFPTKKVSQFCL